MDRDAVKLTTELRKGSLPPWWLKKLETAFADAYPKTSKTAVLVDHWSELPDKIFGVYDISSDEMWMFELCRQNGISFCAVNPRVEHTGWDKIKPAIKG